MEPGSFWWCPVPGQETKWAQSKTQKVLSEYQEIIFSVMVTKHWHRLSREDVEIFKSHLDMVMGS